MIRCVRAIAGWGVLLVAVGWAGNTGAGAAPLQELSGYWTGIASVTLANGSSEQLKCVVTYRVAGAELKQLLRCANPSTTINAQADLTVTGDRISGRWEEKTYAATGDVSGRVTSSGLTLSIQGGSFSAAMSIHVAGCQQSITIAPTSLDVTKIAIELGKC